jgi:hypothetical protein
MRRLSLAQGRVLITTTPYNLGWLKQKFWDKRDSDPDISVIRFDSTANPAFPQAEMERARRDLPLWKFNMFYRAIFTRPAGMIYDNFDEAVHKVRPFEIPYQWPRYKGLDFGGVNTAVVCIAQERMITPEGNIDGRLFVYRDYLTGGRTAKQHAIALTDMSEPMSSNFGGAASEQQWRDEFTAAGMHVERPPVSDVEVGINRVYGAFSRNELFVFDTCAGLLDEIMSYSRELDDSDQPTEKIANKSDFHMLDALRYIITHLVDDTDQQIEVRKYVKHTR